MLRTNADDPRRSARRTATAPGCLAHASAFWHTVFRTVHAGDEVKAYDADWPDGDDKIDSDTIGAEPDPGHYFANSGTLVFIGRGAKDRAKYRAGAC